MPAYGCRIAPRIHAVMVHPTQQRVCPASRKRAYIQIVTAKRTRSFSIRPWAAAVVLISFALVSTAYLAATAYLIYRDDLLGGTLARQVGMQYAYEDRIAALRAELDRVTSRHAVQSKGIGAQLEVLLDRQALIGGRQASLDALAETARVAGVDVAGALARVPRPRPGVPPQEESGTALAYAPEQRSTNVVIDSLIRTPEADERASQALPILSTVGAQLDEIEERQLATLEALAEATDARAEKLGAALAPLGIAPAPKAKLPQGGPYLPVDNMHFVERLSLLDRSLQEVAALRLMADALPLRVPVRAAITSSRFGMRNDPFLNRPAFHAGLDFVASSGAVVLATGAGTIVSAGWSGSYGQLVEINHSEGVTTRYAHLSAVLVRAGDRVVPGTPIGRVGSTGRSTGPHLHYEARRNGEPVDPALFLAAGRSLHAL